MQPKRRTPSFLPKKRNKVVKRSRAKKKVVKPLKKKRIISKKKPVLKKRIVSKKKVVKKTIISERIRKARLKIRREKAKIKREKEKIKKEKAKIRREKNKIKKEKEKRKRKKTVKMIKFESQWDKAFRLVKESQKRGSFLEDYPKIADETGLTPREIYTIGVSPPSFGVAA